MNLFFDVARMLFGKEKKVPVRRSFPPDTVPPICGQIRQARIVDVKEKLALLTAEGLDVIVFIGELADRRIETAHDAVAPNQTVEVVLLEANSRRPGQWIGSLKAVREARRREQLDAMTKGTRHPAVVSAFTPKGVVVNVGDAEFFVPNAEIAWRPVDAPSQVLEIGQAVRVEIVDVFVPVWTVKWRTDRARAIASIRACIARPEATFVPMAFDALPFRLRADIIKPAFLDPVLMHVLQELAHGHDAERISVRTRLPASALAAMFALLEREGLLREGRLSAQARSLIEASEMAHQINNGQPGALYLSMAEPGSRVAGIDGNILNPPVDFPYPIPQYPATWPRPIWHREREDAFLRGTGEDIPAEVMTWCLGKERGQALLAHHHDKRLRVGLTKDRYGMARQRLCTFVRDHWLFGALWTRFDAIGENKPYWPEAGEDTAPILLLVRLSAYAGTEKLARPVYLEPYTSTFWVSRSREWKGGRPQAAEAFPTIPAIGERGWSLSDGVQVTSLKAERWEQVSFEARQ
ncbi:hypothetical protein C2U69_33840 [Cupriavidus pinatubonensis]|nr:hypothetical protein C2U69_33840 [Cupriavidus pinatubonensis]